MAGQNLGNFERTPKTVTLAAKVEVKIAANKLSVLQFRDTQLYDFLEYSLFVTLEIDDREIGREIAQKLL